MKYGKIVKKFHHKEEKVVLRYPKIEDVRDLLFIINSTIEEKAYMNFKKRRP